MTAEDKKAEFQKILIDEYREINQDEIGVLTDEEVAKMNPLTDYDFTMFIERELLNIKKEMDTYLKDIEICEERINDPRTHYQEITEYRNDILYDKKNLNKLREKYEELKSFLPERENEDERGR